PRPRRTRRRRVAGGGGAVGGPRSRGAPRSRRRPGTSRPAAQPRRDRGEAARRKGRHAPAAAARDVTEGLVENPRGSGPDGSPPPPRPLRTLELLLDRRGFHFARAGAPAVPARPGLRPLPLLGPGELLGLLHLREPLGH